MRRRWHRPRARALRVLQEVAGTEDLTDSAPERSFADLHCHTSASFDSLSKPEAVIKAAVNRGLTHLAITDHERIDGALAAQKLAPPDITIIVGEEIRTTDCDVIGLYLEEAVPAGLSAVETARRVHDQGGLVGLPHPYDRFRSSGGANLLEEQLHELLSEVDYIEVFNARLIGSGNHRAAELAARRNVPGTAVSDAHTVFEVAVSYVALDGPIESASDLRAAVPNGKLVMSRGSYYARAVTPVAKVVQRWRGNPRRLSTATPTR